MPDIFQIGADLGELAKTVVSADEKMKLAQAAIMLNDLALENKRLADENAELKKQLARKMALEYRDGSYYVYDSCGNLVGPICPRCYRDEGVINLLEKANGGARCSVCKTRYAGSKASVDGFRQRIC